uniref:Protein I n=1 Tax=Erinaceus amurensis coronavirus TaxID=2778965 RepID=A0A7M1I604_9NIDO|nr:hypothetical protein [Erinaceus amurensis coronavirus]
MEPNKMEIINLEDVQDNKNLGLLPTRLSRGTLVLPSMVSNPLAFLQARAYLLMPIPLPNKMRAIGVGKTDVSILATEPNSLLQDGTFTTLEQDLSQVCLSEQLRMESSGYGKKVLVKPLQILVPGILTMTQLLLRSSLLVLNCLKTATLKAREVIVSHLLEPPAQVEPLQDLTLGDLNLEVEVIHQDK